MFRVSPLLSGVFALVPVCSVAQTNCLTTPSETGKSPRGGKADPPTPTYKPKAEDARAIVEYLKTLK